VPAPRAIVAPQRKKEIVTLAEGFAIEAFGFGAVHPEQLIEEADLTLSRGRYGDAFDGMLEYDGEGFHIYANLDRLGRLDEGRGAFTLGHELGHFYIDEHRHWMEANPGKNHPSFLFSSQAKDTLHEREADIFASSLIMPSPSFRRHVRAPAPSADVVLETAGFFRCSITSTAIRFCEMEPFPCAIIRWSDTGAHLWGRMSARVQSVYGTLARDLADDRSQSLTAEAIRQGLPTARQSRRTTVSEVWFPWAETRSLRKHARLENFSAAIDEHIIPLGGYGFLTLLCGHGWGALPTPSPQPTWS